MTTATPTNTVTNDGPKAYTVPTRDDRIATRRAELAKACAARLDPLDYPRVWTERQCAAHEAEMKAADAQLAAFNDTVAGVAAPSSLDADTKWLADAKTWLTIIDAELLAMPPRIRNEAELALQQRLKWSIKLIEGGFGIAPPSMPIVDLSTTRVGELIQAAGYAVSGDALRGPNGFRGSISEVEARIKLQTAQRANAHGRRGETRYVREPDGTQRVFEVEVPDRWERNGKVHEGVRTRKTKRIADDLPLIASEYRRLVEVGRLA